MDWRRTLSRVGHRSGASTSRGLALMEALVALALVSMALMGLLWAQWKTLADSASSLRRSQAIQLIADLSERVQSNPQARARLDDYRVEWAQAVDALTDCQLEACDPRQLARWDLAHWKRSVEEQLPQGDATVYALSDQSGGHAPALGVMVGWRSSDDSPPKPDDGQVRCPPGWACHFGHVQP
ncbi:type IV pilus modification protein PilV [Variovorax dokdonensis]|uniref:Type IV pilus modification protein PilV n=1 Tax=Variovorax dokdonensis TaxID=344883 RepID=A0ABT7ND05_9BURK|nr:type IV pilus modification protein PilV [Variovorax dokdonensis]MDM0045822.1 type IV pilus modification protein PilV [Variovorax dokdonensis]